MRVCYVQPEPFFLTFALYNAKEGKKISEDFHFDANSDVIRQMLPSEGVHMTDGASHSRPTGNGTATSPSTAAFNMRWLELQKQVSTLHLQFKKTRQLVAVKPEKMPCILKVVSGVTGSLMTSISKFTAECGVKRIFKIGAFGKVMGIAYGQLFGSQWPVARFFL